MSAPVLSRLWIAAAELALDDELERVRPERANEVRSQLRAAAISAEDLMNLVAGPRGAARSTAIAALVERFGDHALDINYMGAAFIEETISSALLEIGVDPGDAGQAADRCRVAVAEAAVALDRLTALLAD